MKVCKFCGRPNDDNSKTCTSCGGVQFNYQCSNCGTLFDSGNFCPKCGIKAGTQPKRCPSCGNEYYSNACPNCGFNNTANRENVIVKESEQPKKKRKTWLWVLGWLFIFPLPLTILLLRKKEMNPILKYGIIAVAWVLFLVIGLAGAGNTDSENINQSSAGRNIRELSFSYSVKDVITLKVGEKNSSGYVTARVKNTSDFSPSDVVFVSENPEIAKISFKRASLSTSLYFEVEAINAGETNVYVTSVDGSITSKKIKVVVTGASVRERIDSFVKIFNNNSEVKLEFVEEFLPQEKTNKHYRTEFRLSAYSGSLGKSFQYNEATIDLIARKPGLLENEPVIRLYAKGVKLDECISIIKSSVHYFDPEMTPETIKEITDYLTEKKSANGYYKGNIGLTLLGDELMIKFGND